MGTGELTLADACNWWVIPYAFLMLLMVHAMMEFTVSLLVKEPSVRRKPLDAKALKHRLLSAIDQNSPFQLTEGHDSDLEIFWREEMKHMNNKRGLYRLDSTRRLRVLLDEYRHEVRLNEVSHSLYYMLGLSGWLPSIRFSASFQSGPPGLLWSREISQIARESGWKVRPVLWWFQATHKGFRFLTAITPAPLRHMSSRLFWGFIYILSFVLGIILLAVMLGPLDSQDWMMVLAVSAAWWITWAILVWILLGFPAFWRQ